MIIQDVQRAACQVSENRLLNIQAQLVVERGKNLPKMDRTLLRMFTKTIGCSDHLAGFQPTARQ